MPDEIANAERQDNGNNYGYAHTGNGANNNYIHFFCSRFFLVKRIHEGLLSASEFVHINRQLFDVGFA